MQSLLQVIESLVDVVETLLDVVEFLLDVVELRHLDRAKPGLRGFIHFVHV